MLIDLHTHSTASDGLLAPAELARAAHVAGLTTIALTDHDITDGIAAAQDTGTAFGLEVISGVELNTELPDGGEAHVLGYFIDPGNTAFQERLAVRRSARERRGRQIVQKLQDIGLPITWEQVLRHAKGAVGRPHVAEALIESGVVGSVPEAFDRYLARGKPGFVPREVFTPVEAVQTIRNAGGVASLAHPAYIAVLDDLLASMVAAGLSGLECHYGQYDDATVRRLLSVAAQYHLIPTGGSDYHGPGIHPTPLGGHPVPAESLAELREAARR